MEGLKGGRIVVCPRCDAKYRFPEKDSQKGPTPPVRCVKCGTVFEIESPTNASAPFTTDDAPQATVLTRGDFELPQGKVVSLSIIRGTQKGKVFQLSKPYIVMGRTGADSIADITIDDPKVSRRHCAVEIHGNTALLIDLGSTNGTFVEDKKIDTAELEHLSEFRIGSSTVLFSVTDEERWEITGVPGKSA
jgi:hypothetical protein